MNKFKFSAKSVLRHKGWLEKEAQRILGLELKKLSDCYEDLGNLEKERKRFLKDRREKKDLNSNTHLAYIEFDKKLSQDIIHQKQKIEAQQIVVNSKTGELNTAMTEKKKMEKLRERELREYKKKSKRQETSIMNEVSSNYYDRYQENE